jgi:hypothetical protein
MVGEEVGVVDCELIGMDGLWSVMKKVELLLMVS